MTYNVSPQYQQSTSLTEENVASCRLRLQPCAHVKSSKGRCTDPRCLSFPLCNAKY